MQSNAPGYSFDPTLNGFDNTSTEGFSCLSPEEETADGLGASFTAHMPDYCANPNPERLSADQRLECGYRPSLSPDEQKALHDWQQAEAARAAGIHATAGGPDTITGFVPNVSGLFGGGSSSGGEQKSYKKWILIAIAVGIGAWGLYKLYHRYNLGRFLESDNEPGVAVHNPPRRRRKSKLLERLSGRRQATRKRPRRNPSRKAKCSTRGCRRLAKHNGLCRGCAPQSNPVEELKRRVSDAQEESDNIDDIIEDDIEDDIDEDEE